jgi:hypothetical protein
MEGYEPVMSFNEDAAANSRRTSRDELAAVLAHPGVADPNLLITHLTRRRPGRALRAVRCRHPRWG